MALLTPTRAVLPIFAGAVLAASSPARAERATFVTLDGELALRAKPYVTQPDVPEPDVYGGGRVRLSFEDLPPPIPDEPGKNRIHLTVVPELLGGFLAGSEKAEAVVGAGLRGDMVISGRGKRGFPVGIQIAAYFAVRGEVIGEDHDPAGEFVVGEYIYVKRNSIRIGFEGGVFARRSAALDQPNQTITPPGAILSMYVGWRL